VSTPPAVIADFERDLFRECTSEGRKCSDHGEDPPDEPSGNRPASAREEADENQTPICRTSILEGMFVTSFRDEDQWLPRIVRHPPATTA
jgi:hypothetical protein